MENLNDKNIMWVLKNIEKNTHNFLSDISGDLKDGKGIKANSLFNLTFDASNSKISERKVSLRTGEDKSKSLFHALCPELESYITIINWLGDLDSANININKIQTFTSMRKSSKTYNSIWKLDNNFRIKLNEFSSINLYYGKIEKFNKEILFYDWERVPFLKRDGDLFDTISNPLFMSLRDSEFSNNINEKYSVFTSLFKLITINQNLIKIEVFNLTNKYSKQFEINCLNKEILNILINNKNEFFLGLFEDIYDFKGEECFRRFNLTNISGPLDGEEILAHNLTLYMYNRYLLSDSLLICSKEYFDEKLKHLSYIINKFYKKEMSGFLLWYESYINTYFKLFENNIYYKPFIFKFEDNTFNEFIKYHDKKYNSLSTMEQLEYYKLKRKYPGIYDLYKFINLYIKASRFDQIKKLEHFKERWEK